MRWIKLIRFIAEINEDIFFYPTLKKTYKTLFPIGPRKVVDIGTNRGQSIDFFLRINPSAEIWSFEPNPKLFIFLRGKYQGYPNIHLSNLGISDKEGALTFYENILDETSSFEVPNIDSIYLKNKAKILGLTPENLISDSYQINTTTITKFLEDFDGGTIDVLKIDVEGHEFNCIKGLSHWGETIPIKYIQMERHNNDLYNQDKSLLIDQILEDLGFEKIRVVSHGFAKYSELIFKNTRIA